MRRTFPLHILIRSNALERLDSFANFAFLLLFLYPFDGNTRASFRRRWSSEGASGGVSSIRDTRFPRHHVPTMHHDPRPTKSCASARAHIPTAPPVPPARSNLLHVLGQLVEYVKVAHLDALWTHKNAAGRAAVKVARARDAAVVAARGLVERDADPRPGAGKLRHGAHEADSAAALVAVARPVQSAAAAPVSSMSIARRFVGAKRPSSDAGAARIVPSGKWGQGHGDVPSRQETAAAAGLDAAELELELRALRPVLGERRRGRVEAAEGVRALVREHRVGKRLVRRRRHGVLVDGGDVGQRVAQGGWAGVCDL